MILGDTINVGDPPVALQLWRAYKKLGHPVIAVERVRREKISDYGIVDGDASPDERVFRIRDLIEKPTPEEAPSDLGISGTYVLTPAIFDAIRQTPPGKNGEVQLTDALRILLRDEPLYGYRFEGRRFDIGTKLDWFRAHVELTLMHDEFREPARRILEELLHHG